MCSMIFGEYPEFDTFLEILKNLEMKSMDKSNSREFTLY